MLGNGSANNLSKPSYFVIIFGRIFYDDIVISFFYPLETGDCCHTTKLYVIPSLLPVTRKHIEEIFPRYYSYNDANDMFKFSTTQ